MGSKVSQSKKEEELAVEDLLTEEWLTEGEERVFVGAAVAADSAA